MCAHPNPLDLTTPPVEPDCYVAPRYLAGPSGPTGGIHHLLSRIEGAGWRVFTDHEGSYHLYSPDHLECAAYLPHGKILLPGVLGSGDRRWHLWGRKAATGPADWHATATAACPPEFLVQAIDVMAHGELDTPVGDGEYGAYGEYGMGPLADAGWERPFSLGYHAPSHQATVTFIPIRDVFSPNAHAQTVAWRAEARTGPAKPTVWRADFTATTPPLLITAFCAALANPNPLPRHTAHLAPALSPHLSLTSSPCATRRPDDHTN